MMTVKSDRYMCILEKTVLQTRDSPNFIHFEEINFGMFEGSEEIIVNNMNYLLHSYHNKSPRMAQLELKN